MALGSDSFSAGMRVSLSACRQIGFGRGRDVGGDPYATRHTAPERLKILVI